MGRAAPDLPDPLENTESAPAAGGADDLLSQLAGDEIDRLLAEADVEAAPPAGAADATEEAPPAFPTDVAEPAAEVPAAPTLDTQLDELFNSLNQAPPTPGADATPDAGGAAPPVAKPSAVAATDLDEQLAKLANELLPAPEPAEALTPVDATTPPVEIAVEAEAILQDAPVADEREALLAESRPEDDEAPPEALYEDGPVPWYLRPLVWLNAPFASLSDAARDRVGKVALATLLFSITVLTFLAFARHHP